MKQLSCILLIDDDLAGNAFHTIIINQSNTCKQVRTANNGRKALDYIMKSGNEPSSFPRPDIIFLDINMPGMNGFEFLDEYKNLSFEPGVKPVIVMLSTSSNPDDKSRAISYNDVSEFQNKPLTVEMIKDIVRRYFPQTEQEVVDKAG